MTLIDKVIRFVVEIQRRYIKHLKTLFDEDIFECDCCGSYKRVKECDHIREIDDLNDQLRNAHNTITRLERDIVQANGGVVDRRGNPIDGKALQKQVDQLWRQNQALSKKIAELESGRE